MASVLIEEQVEIPLGIACLADFRQWALSDDFPERGRIDFIAGRIEVDMSPEDLFTHGTLKSEIAGEIKDRVNHLDNHRGGANRKQRNGPRLPHQQANAPRDACYHG